LFQDLKPEMLIPKYRDSMTDLKINEQ